MDKFLCEICWFFKLISPLQHSSAVILQPFRGTLSAWGLMFKCNCYSKGGDRGSGGCSVEIIARTCGATYKPFRTFLSQGHCWVWPCPRCRNDNCKNWWVWFLPSSPDVGLDTLRFEPHMSKLMKPNFWQVFMQDGGNVYHTWFWCHFLLCCATGGSYFGYCYGKFLEIKHDQQDMM